MTVSDDTTGNADAFQFGLHGIRIGQGDMLQLPGPGSVTAVVGANNVGKSTLLNNIFQILQSQSLTRSEAPCVVSEILSPWGGTTEDMLAWLQVNARFENRNGRPQINRKQKAYEVSTVAAWRRDSATPMHLAPWFVSHQRPAERIEVCQGTGQLATIGDPPTHPMHVLRTDENARLRAHELAEKIFGIDLYLDVLASNLYYRIGDPGLPTPGVNEVTTEYARAVAALPMLNDQGDGIRSTLGLLIPLITDNMPLTLIDEPEAFLHPPQAKIVGREIGKIVQERQSQVVLATHDKNMLLGLIESGAPVSIIHLTRTDEGPAAKQLKVDDVKALWEDITLRYGDALNGLFHSAVILTEGDRDSHFYAAAIDVEHTDTSPDSPAHNLMFIGSNGKQNLAKYVERLDALGVRTVSCPDLDILNDAKKLRALVEAHRGDWSQIESDYNKATAEFHGVPKPPTAESVKAAIEAIFAQNVDEVLTEGLAGSIVHAAKLSKTGWGELKSYGTLAFKADKTAAGRLLDALDCMGIVTVRVGVLENFLTTKSAPKGPGWLPIAFAEGAHKTTAAREQARRLLTAAGVP
ncbi:AAA family ATPase [Mycobacteroides abscessus]|uniref:AAA family ATPase n=1 Tax=Mycobacteroides abscessus TaxID=36809 RepID=UPI002101FE3D|nr:AAA family ATPase [Mycobacteroides abscessus]